MGPHFCTCDGLGHIALNSAMFRHLAEESSTWAGSTLLMSTGTSLGELLTGTSVVRGAVRS